MFKEVLLENITEKRGSKRSKVHGIGINDAPYKTSITIQGVKYTCPYYARWLYMLNRCHSKNWLKRHPTYIGCTIHPEWYVFSSFKSWMLTQDWKDKQLDKDLLSLGNKHYSPANCLFVSRQINSLFNERENDQGDLPLGVYKRNDKYEVGISYGKGKRTWVGAYSSIPEAIDAYVFAKVKAVQIALQNEPNKQVRDAVKKYSIYFTDKLNMLKTAY